MKNDIFDAPAIDAGEARALQVYNSMKLQLVFDFTHPP